MALQPQNEETDRQRRKYKEAEAEGDVAEVEDAGGEDKVS
jgi:hypothetical protein